MFYLPRLALAALLPAVVFGQTQIELQQSRYTAAGAGAVTRSGADKLSDVVSVKDYGAKGDGVTDDLPAINAAISAVAGKGQRILFPPGTYMISGTIVLPDKASIIGVGRGDANYVNTVIKALPGFTGSTMVQMGITSPSFGIQVEKMTIDGSSIVGTCLSNQAAEELSYGRDLLLNNCPGTALLISGTGAQNSGPFENLEIYPGSGASVNSNSMCVKVTGLVAFRGIRGLTCNASPSYASRPAIGLSLDGDGHYSDIHVEHVGTAISLGSTTSPADGVVLSNAQFGPDVTVGVQITNAQNNQNLSIMGISCNGCTSLLNDAEMGTNITDASLGWYMMGNGNGGYKPMLSGNNGQGVRFYGQMMQEGNATIGPSNGRTNATLSIYDARPTGVTSVVEVGGAQQGSASLHEWHDKNDTPVAAVGSDGKFFSSAFSVTNNAVSVGTSGTLLASWAPINWSMNGVFYGVANVGLLPITTGMLGVTDGGSGSASMRMLSLQLAPSGTQPTCSATVRGTFWFVQSASGTADHVQVCSKNASNAYVWTSVF